MSQKCNRKAAGNIKIITKKTKQNTKSVKTKACTKLSGEKVTKMWQNLKLKNVIQVFGGKKHRLNMSTTVPCCHFWLSIRKKVNTVAFAFKTMYYFLKAICQKSPETILNTFLRFKVFICHHTLNVVQRNMSSVFNHPSVSLGQFVRSSGRYGNSTRDHLPLWSQNHGQSPLDFDSFSCCFRCL